MSQPPIRPYSRTQAAGLICICKRVSETPFDRCSGCKRVFYCSTSCQTADWQKHKRECRLLKAVNKYDATRGHTAVDLSTRLEYFVEEMNSRLRKIGPSVGSDYDHRHPDIISYGQKCQVCFRTPFHGPEGVLTPCPTCQLAWWCSPECGAIFTQVAHTSQHCKALTLVHAVDSVKTAYLKARGTGQHLMLRTEVPQRVYTPPSSLTGWDDYKSELFPDFDFAAEFTSQEFSHIHPKAALAVEAMAIDSSSIVLTLLHALEIVLPDLETRRTLCIHVLWSGERDLETQGMTEELLHFLPFLQTVTVVYVGLQVVPMFWRGDDTNLACEVCTRNGRSRHSLRRTATYHNFISSETSHQNHPDLVAGFNPSRGQMESEEWRASMQAVIDSGVPAVFTAYSLPLANLHISLLEACNPFYLRDVERNIWRGMVPKPREQDELAMIEASHYTNNYWFMIRGAAEAS
ncbi:MYND-type domain-containing protein [Mycena indigotica]|uniref:MYND-type domain-containing protein n=1 Tax=Mycena indigotica TaxID=2126181 RepID=A0A8H6S1D2_9AGAR|nr:MYND-type domain-containing protein [Mycena indigotica]KAF7290647.1 MYND-type domain-containing protein [Mycena indigotica]